jgi:hypothetical protein
MNQIIEWSKGNPGALMFLMGLMENCNTIHGLSIVLKLTECTSIRGTNLYVLFSDLCGKSYETTAKLCKSCPNDVLEDACSRQDYSGRKIVAEYLS